MFRSVHSAVPRVAWEHENLDVRSALGNPEGAGWLYKAVGTMALPSLYGLEQGSLCDKDQPGTATENLAAAISRVHTQSTAS